MAFWQDGKNLKPKRAYRFTMLVAGQGRDASGREIKTTIPEFLVKKVDKPSFSISESNHSYLNHTFYYPGRVTWNDVKLTIVDVASGDVDGTQAVMDMLEASGYRLPLVGDKTTISKSSSISALGKIVIKQIDEMGTEVDRWTLFNSWIKDATFGSLDYTSDDMMNVDITIKYDNATFKSVGAGGVTRPSNAPGN